jgi:site-specific recombinase XerC
MLAVGRPNAPDFASAFTPHLYDAGTDLCTIQKLLGHYDLKETARYIHLSQRHMKDLVNPLDQLPQFSRTTKS